MVLFENVLVILDSVPLNVVVGQTPKRAERRCVGDGSEDEEGKEGPCKKVKTKKKWSDDSLNLKLPSRKRYGKEYIRVKSLEEAKKVVEALGMTEFHGTSVSAAISVGSVGVGLKFGRPKNELSPRRAFYTTDSLQFAIESAVGRSRTALVTEMTTTPAVILFSPGPNLNMLPHVTLSPGVEYQKFVARFITHTTDVMTGEQIAAEWVKGPICKSTAITQSSEVRWHLAGLETAWRTKQAAKLLDESRSPVVLEFSSQFPKQNLE